MICPNTGHLFSIVDKYIVNLSALRLFNTSSLDTVLVFNHVKLYSKETFSFDSMEIHSLAKYIDQGSKFQLYHLNFKMLTNETRLGYSTDVKDPFVKRFEIIKRESSSRK